MSSHRGNTRRLTLAAVGAVPLMLLAAPAAVSAPSYDDQGYLNSTARCASPEALVLFGSTAGSRVAICRDADGDYEYRGVRVRDGAKLIAAASRSSDGAFTASNDGIDYMVTSAALVISTEEKVIRDEPMLDFHRADSPEAPQTPAEGEETTPTPTTPLPPPLPAEVGATDDEGSVG